MIWLDIEQNTPEWEAARAGKLTASHFGEVMANAPKAFGEPAKRLAVKIAFERLNGVPMSEHYGESWQNAEMQRGHIEEPEARRLYEAEQLTRVSNGGFFCDDFIGCSPDGLVGQNGLVEIKSVLPHVHAANKKRGSFDPAYKWQIIGNLACTGREWLDFVSYCSFAPQPHQILIYRVWREQQETAIKQLVARQQRFRELTAKFEREFE